MNKIYLFYNDVEHSKPILYKEYLKQNMDSVLQESLMKFPYGMRNTGTYMMTDSLRDIIDADKLIPRFYDFNENVDIVVTNILHRIGSNLKIDFNYWDKILKHTEKVIPLSIGFSQDMNKYNVNDDLKKFLEILAERAELGTRTEYDAEILNSIGIKNVRVIGCPSMFCNLDRNFCVDDSNIKLDRVNFNFTTDFSNLGISQREAVEVHWPLLLYFINLFENGRQIDFTMQKPPFTEISDIHGILLSYGEVHEFYKNCGRYFYSAKDWVQGIKNTDTFSMGTRFHGNVAAIMAGVPTLMVNVDNRMVGMNKFYKIPYIDIKDFDAQKPLEFYREIADYSEFNKNYSRVYDNFIDYCEKVGIRLKERKNDNGIEKS